MPAIQKSFKMKKSFSVFLFVAGFLLNAAQTQGIICNATGGPGSIGKLPVNLQEASFPGPYYIKLYFHVLERPDGTQSQTVNEINIVMDNLAAMFDPHNIFFFRDCHIEPIPVMAAQYVNPSLHTLYLFGLTQYEYSDGISIFLGPDIATGPQATIDATIPTRKLWATGNFNYQNVNLAVVTDHLTIPHEMGHVLGLWHTHHGTTCVSGECDPVMDPDVACELVDGSNGFGAGDYVPNTGADPLAWFVDQNCENLQFGTAFGGFPIALTLLPHLTLMPTMISTLLRSTTLCLTTIEGNA